MNTIYKELPIVFPFYEYQPNQDRYRENIEGLNQFNLISPVNAFLPFQIEMPANKPHPTSWVLFKLGGDGTVVQNFDLATNWSKIKIYEFADRKVATYNGEALTINGGEAMNLSCGYYYTDIRFNDGTHYYSEVFFIPENAFAVGAVNDFIKIDFWNEKDIIPILYRDNFRQTIYLNTFVHSFEPEIEQETEKDGFNNEIPIFSKLTLRYKFTEVVPDYIKTALISLQMHDKVTITTKYRAGEIDRVQVTAQPHEGGGFNDVDVVFEDNILYKTKCESNQPANNITTW